MAGGWSAVPNLFLNTYSKLGLTPTEAMLIVHLFSYKWDRRRPFPSVSMMAAKLGLSDSRVRVLLRGLEKKELIRRVKRTGRSNEYDVDGLIGKLEELKALDKTEPEFAMPF